MAAALPDRRGPDVPAPFSLREPLEFFTWPRVAKMLVLAALFFWLFHGTLIRLFLVWWEVPDWSHGLLIPAFCVGIFLFLYDRWRGVELRPAWWGLAIIAGALIFNVLAVWWWQAIMFQDYSWWLLLIGMIVTLCGWRFTRAIWFPIFFILFGIRIGGVIYNPISTKLQQMAAWSSMGVLRMVGVNAELEGVVISLFTRSGDQARLQVAEACSGMRILMAFAALGTLMAYMARRPWWHRWALVAAIVPIAIVSNVLRVTGMGVLHYLDKDEWATGYAHMLEGLLMLVPAFLLFWGLHALLSRLVVEEPDEPGAGRPADGSAAGDNPAERRDPPSGLDQGHDGVRTALEGLSRGLGRAWRYLGERARNPGLLRADLKAAIDPLRPAFREQHFLALAGVMLVAAASWQTVMALAGGIFVKEPVPLRQMLDRFPRQIASADGGRWVALDGNGRDELPRDKELLDQDTEKFLGAVHPYHLRGQQYPEPGQADPPKLLKEPQYVQRYYKYEDATGAEVGPAGRAYLFISYYTGQPDAVPHVPDRCYLGGGFQELAREDVTIQVNGQTVPIRRMAFGKGVSSTNVIYFFHYNGRMSSKHLAVRNYLNNPLVKHAYFAKIEVKFPGMRGEDLPAATAAAQSLLTDFLPVLQDQFLPDWSQYEGTGGSNLGRALVPAGLGGAVLVIGAVLLLRRRSRRAMGPASSPAARKGLP